MKESSEITRVLRDNRKRLTGLFRQLEAIPLRAPEMQRGVMCEALALIEIHAALEQIFYRVIEAVLPEVRPSIEQGRQDLQEITGGIEAGAPMQTTIRLMEEHLEKEERDLFPRIQAFPPEAGKQLAEMLDQEFHSLIESPRFRDARPEAAQNPNGGEQMRTG
jgi:hypothetical protein